MTRCHLFQLLHAWTDAAEQNQILVNATTILHFYNCTETLLLVDSTFALKVIVLHWCWGQDVVQPVSVSPACIPDSGYCLIGLVDRPAGGGLALLKAHRRVNTWVTMSTSINVHFVVLDRQSHLTDPLKIGLLRIYIISVQPGWGVESSLSYFKLLLVMNMQLKNLLMSGMPTHKWLHLKENTFWTLETKKNKHAELRDA